MTRIITDSNGRKHITNEPLLHPPQRTWVGLTDKEIMQCLDQGYGINMRLDGFARIIEAKLKEKNT
jgi:hypothetical protein